jgi:hypothetical protein
MIQYLFGYGSFLLGAGMYILGKIQEFKEMAEANPDPKIVYSLKHLIQKEWVNFVRLLIGGVALVIFLPMLIGGATVDLKNVQGSVITTVSLETLLIPFYFFVGYSGLSGLLSLFGKYKKTLLNQVGVDSN